MRRGLGHDGQVSLYSLERFSSHWGFHWAGFHLSGFHFIGFSLGSFYKGLLLGFHWTGFHWGTAEP